ncbi:hypothetical protein Q0Z83_064270 [Actinoplanes sichuanensis]|uniref:DUF6193 family natural product biosynthesis protein n=1 Tax=Actinoplanes sichuanensis TaxID=512349 RepID=A0ABW4ALN3_9ACTN|nr:DUF6193 family natural product biosynthesis protein [Actinoplanes sichuanensis]BEL08236.1 hypothetical protein Q0Z83_064270 [Actinoplanes sichuanensis]
MPSSQWDNPYYPDVVAAGSFRAALQNAFDQLGLRLKAEHVSSPGWVHTHAVVSDGDRHAYVHLMSGERAFVVDFWMSGMRMAEGSAPDLAPIAAAVDVYLGGADLRQLHAAWPFVKYHGLAEAFERGQPEAIEFTWRRMLTDPPRHDRRDELRDFLVAAAEEPRLRALHPSTSHFDLGLRRFVRAPQNPALAWVRPFGDGRYLIAGPDRRRLYTPGPIRRTIWDEEPIPGALGPAPAQESVTLVLTALDRSAPPADSPR